MYTSLAHGRLACFLCLPMSLHKYALAAFNQMHKPVMARAAGRYVGERLRVPRPCPRAVSPARRFIRTKVAVSSETFQLRGEAIAVRRVIQVETRREALALASGARCRRRSLILLDFLPPHPQTTTAHLTTPNKQRRPWFLG